MVHTIIAFLVIFTLISNPSETKEYVIIGLGTDNCVLDVYQGKLRTRIPTLKGSGYVIDSIEYYADWKTIKNNYTAYSIESSLSIRDSLLYFENKNVMLSKNVKMRAIWQAVKIEDWIICLGRTSLTDNIAQLRPPFIATELITFSTKSLKADVRFISSFAPNDIRLWINLVKQ